MDPGKFRVLPIWTNKKLQCSTRLQAEAASKRCSNAAVQRHGSGFENAIDIARLLASKQQWDNWVLHPNSAKRFVYDMLCVFLILYDVMVVPLQLLDPMDMTGIAIMFWVSLYSAQASCVHACNSMHAFPFGGCGPAGYARPHN
eukprot:TRINITY_DN14819_c0_g1_i2.p1 TRINITY_DN14819_c0_g1~~TRINITY_DN14819_c0_g1_i2.p1  ORF type:complete len:144 (+),score=7.41 TRINITY_DN14819_c0_g1_i2:852-1283(+)